MNDVRCDSFFKATVRSQSTNSPVVWGCQMLLVGLRMRPFGKMYGCRTAANSNWWDWEQGTLVSVSCFLSVTTVSCQLADDVQNPVCVVPSVYPSIFGWSVLHPGCTPHFKWSLSSDCCAIPIYLGLFVTFILIGQWRQKMNGEREMGNYREKTEPGSILGPWTNGTTH